MDEHNCLAGCIKNYVCQSVDVPGPAKEQAESFAPWCWIKFGADGNKITVGNESYETDPNTACIKSMEIGWTDKPSMKCEIIDEKGGTLGIVANAIRKCIKTGETEGGGAGTWCEFQFGWIVTTCEGGKRVIPSPTFQLMITQLDVNYSEGKIKYIMEATTYDELYDKSREDNTKGEDSKPVDIETAIRSLCAQDPACQVRFVELTKDGKLKDTEFDWVGGKPKASWQTDNMNRISTITKWLAPFRVKDGKCDKGLIVFFNPRKPDEMMIIKDPMANPGEAKDCEGGDDKNEPSEWGPLGTFIVNAGKCSTVIEFTPTMNIINAVSSLAVGGDTSGPNKSANQFDERRRCENQQAQGTEAGTQLQATLTQQAFDVYGVKTANEQALRSEIVHNRAGMVTSVVNPGVEAQLKILGNPSPTFCNWGACRNLSIVVINPFHIRNAGKCGDWLASPGCNELFTNRLWMTRSINHSIQVGNYTTTIEAFLVAPNIQISSMEPLGGEGGGGPEVPNGCS